MMLPPLVNDFAAVAREHSMRKKQETNEKIHVCDGMPFAD